MAIDAADVAETRVLPRTLAGATVLQIVPALRDTSQVRTTIGAARALVQVGARAIVAGERGDLVDDLKAFGGEWLPFASTTFNPAKLRANAAALDRFVAAERVDIVHAKNAGAAWSALVATDRNSICLITDLPDLPRRRMWLASIYLGALSRGDRVISHSMYNARPMIARHRIPVERVSVIPRSIDLEYFDPATIQTDRIAALRRAWGIPSGMRIVLVPGRIAPWNGHMTLVHAARLLSDNGFTDVTFVMVGDDRRHRRSARAFWKRAQEQNVDALFRMVGHHEDMPSAYAAADLVVVPYTSAPVYGRVVAEAQSMARPVVATTVGPLPENMLAPPRIAEELRTGWDVPPGNPTALARALADALSLDDSEFRAMAARARAFAQYMFSPHRAAAATLEIYASLLETQG
ncbi:MAG: glycosyltransferase family 4 protein [Alphaproteobacteria bacterium]|nr:glycosyltransferase family 4 protein [Alphaproteobacteria bacterium]